MALALRPRATSFTEGDLLMSVHRSLVPCFAIVATMSLLVITAACDDDSPAPSPTPAADVTITIQGNRGNQSYSPNPVTVRVGQTVAWRNADSIAHTSTQDTRPAVRSR
jgi:plastocyanin